MNKFKALFASLVALVSVSAVGAYAAIPGPISTMFDNMEADGADYITAGVAILVVFTGGFIAMKVAKKLMSKAT